MKEAVKRIPEIIKTSKTSCKPLRRVIDTPTQQRNRGLLPSTSSLHLEIGENEGKRCRSYDCGREARIKIYPKTCTRWKMKTSSLDSSRKTNNLVIKCVHSGILQKEIRLVIEELKKMNGYCRASKDEHRSVVAQVKKLASEMATQAQDVLAKFSDERRWSYSLEDRISAILKSVNSQKREIEFCHEAIEDKRHHLLNIEQRLSLKRRELQVINQVITVNEDRVKNRSSKTSLTKPFTNIDARDHELYPRHETPNHSFKMTESKQYPKDQGFLPTNRDKSPIMSNADHKSAQNTAADHLYFSSHSSNGSKLACNTIHLNTNTHHTNCSACKKNSKYSVSSSDVFSLAQIDSTNLMDTKILESIS